MQGLPRRPQALRVQSMRNPVHNERKPDQAPATWLMQTAQDFRQPRFCRRMYITLVFYAFILLEIGVY